MNSGGAIFPFPVECLEDGVDDEVHRRHVDEVDQRGALAHFDQAALESVGCVRLFP